MTRTPLIDAILAGITIKAYGKSQGVNYDATRQQLCREIRTINKSLWRLVNSVADIKRFGKVYGHDVNQWMVKFKQSPISVSGYRSAEEALADLLKWEAYDAKIDTEKEVYLRTLTEAIGTQPDTIVAQIINLSRRHQRSKKFVHRIDLKDVCRILNVKFDDIYPLTHESEINAERDLPEPERTAARKARIQKLVARFP